MATLGEATLLKRLARLLGRPWQAGRGAAAVHRLGVGDDAAVVPGHGGRHGYAVACCDLLVEDVDFRRRWASFADVGHKAAAVNLSDLAAMGASPTGLLLGLAAQPDERVDDVLALVAAVHRVGRAYGAPLVGGDLSRTRGPLVISVTALGSLDGQAPLRRYSGEIGDAVLVFGTLGAARAGLELLERNAADALRARWAAPLLRRQRRPTPQLALGRTLGAVRGVHAVADLSDGLLADAAHLVGGTAGVRLEAARLPIARGVLQAAQLAADGVGPRAKADAAAARALAQRWALSGGEDFVLVAAVAPRAVTRVRRAAADVGVRAHVVGEVVRGRGVQVVGERGRTLSAGCGVAFDHFT